VLNETDLAEKLVIDPQQETAFADLMDTKTTMEFDTNQNMTGVDEVVTKELEKELMASVKVKTRESVFGRKSFLAELQKGFTISVSDLDPDMSIPGPDVSLDEKATGRGERTITDISRCNDDTYDIEATRIGD
jgi:hypothetical protein